LPDDSDNVCAIERLLDENQQLQEENQQLRNDIEHLIHTMRAMDRSDKR